MNQPNPNTIFNSPHLFLLLNVIFYSIGSGVLSNLCWAILQYWGLKLYSFSPSHHKICSPPSISQCSVRIFVLKKVFLYPNNQLCIFSSVVTLKQFYVRTLRESTVEWVIISSVGYLVYFSIHSRPPKWLKIQFIKITFLYEHPEIGVYFTQMPLFRIGVGYLVRFD